MDKFLPEELLTEIYHDTLQPSFQEASKTISFFPRVINHLLSKLDFYLLKSEYQKKELIISLENRLKSVEESKLVAPEPFVAIPALNAYSYSMDNQTLKNLYVNLLANAMNIDTKEFVHPAYVEIIKQMSPNDALVLNEINKMVNLPILQAIAVDKAEFYTFQTLLSDISILENLNININMIRFFLANLNRLGLIELNRDANISEYESLYKKIESNGIVQNIIATTNIDIKDYEIKFVRGYAALTPFGENFMSICYSD